MTMIAFGMSPWTAVKAFSTSEGSIGVPFTMVRPSLAGTDEGFRIRAVTVWPRCNASLMTREPVCPLPPMTRKRMMKMV